METGEIPVHLRSGIRPVRVGIGTVRPRGADGRSSPLPVALAAPVADGLRLVDELALANIALQNLNLLDMGSDFGEFDYILCHGVY
jgi:hypothetical protein